jgi:predicted PurR-regulated permease PerM
MPPDPKPELKQPAISFYLLLAAALFVLIEAFYLLSPILLSFLLIVLISLAVNPVISRLRASTGGRKGATGLVAVTLGVVVGLTAWAFFVPMKASVTKLTERLPSYWERLQKPLIKMEQQAVRSEERLQAEVTTEIARTEPAVARPEAAPRATDPGAQKPAKESGSLRSSLSEMLQGVVGRFTAVAFNAAQILVVLVTVFFGVIFTLMNPRPIFGAMFSLVPERHHEQTLAILQRIGKFVPGWAGVTLLGMLTIGLLVFLLMWALFGFMDALVLG